MTDYLELDSMLSRTNLIEEPQYEKVEWVQLSDEQGGVYDSGYVSFDTKSQGTTNTVISESVFALPVKVTMADDKKLTVKNSILSLIAGLDIRSSAGTPIDNDTSGAVGVLANLKLLLDSAIDYHLGNELMFFGKDQYIDPDVSRKGAARLSMVGGVQPTVSSRMPEIDPFHNPALSSRIAVFDSRATPFVQTADPVGHRTLIAFIPLKFLHDFFAQMHFPLPNLALKMQFNIAGVGSYAHHCPWTCPSAAAHRTLGHPDAATSIVPAAAAAPSKDEFNNLLAGMVAPAVTALPKPVTEIMVTGTDRTGYAVKPSLFLKTVYFNAEHAAKLASEIVSGFEKKIVFSIARAYPRQLKAAHVDEPIARGVIRPSRMWVLPIENATTSSQTNSFPAVIGPNIMTNFNIMLNGNKLYNNDFRSQMDFYREYKTQCIGAGAASQVATPISYTDWCNGQAAYVFDISRNPTVKSNNPNELHVYGDVKQQSWNANGVYSIADNVDFTLLTIIESLVTATIKVSSGGVVILTKPGTE